MEKVPLGPAGVLETLCEADEIDRGQEWRADDLGLCVGLQDAADGCADIKIGDLCFLDQIGELARAKAAPPVEAWRRGLALPGAIFGRDLGRELSPLGGEHAPGQHLHET
jgi:hypothetical protein